MFSYTPVFVYRCQGTIRLRETRRGHCQREAFQFSGLSFTFSVKYRCRIGTFVTVYQFWAVLGQFFLGTVRVPGWSPTPPLASCHRDTNRAVLGQFLRQFWEQFWALPGRPGPAQEAQKGILTVTEVPIRPRNIAVAA